MKNTIKLFGIITFVVIIGFSLVACSDGSSGDGNSSENTGGNNPVGSNPGGNNPGGNNPGGNDPGGNNGVVQSFSFPSQLKNTTWLKDGTTAGYTHVYIRFNTDTFEYTYRKTDGSMQYGPSTYVDSMNGNTYHMLSGGTFTATVSGNKLTTTSSSWGPSLIGTFTKQ
ncbi:MAG: hypothetical protein LBI28_06750 [Treponema sp.]|jgi:hypothetical protein|nr:hypothetical protein [Treponema sp.]